ncbi:MAG TPA: hypothetical protein PKC72_00895 [Chitinophagaceae bacterium]|nr:hypothetical protein [Chitinophagaceae bacterium]
MRNISSKKLGAIAMLLSVAVIFFSCSRKMNFGISHVTPAAEGYVKLNSDKNNNTAIKVKVNNLAPAERLGSSDKVYVVWMRTKKNGIRNIGQLEGKSDLLSSARSAELQTITVFEPTSFFITAETDAAVQIPGPEVILKTI